jgi:hypothetical protein
VNYELHGMERDTSVCDMDTNRDMTYTERDGARAASETTETEDDKEGTPHALKRKTRQPENHNGDQKRQECHTTHTPVQKQEQHTEQDESDSDTQTNMQTPSSKRTKKLRAEREHGTARERTRSKQRLKH